MPVQLVNCRAGDKVSQSDKFRVTWAWSLSELFGGAFAHLESIDRPVRDALPGMGFVPVSSPMAVAGDRVLVYDVRPSMDFGAGNRTVADMVVALDKLPFIADAMLDVSKVEKISNTVGSSALAAGQAAAVQAGNAAADAAKESGPLAPITDLTNKVGTAATVALAVVVAGIAWFVYKTVR